MYWPMMGTLKGCLVPEDLRSSIYSLYRVPLHAAVLITLFLTSSVRQSFLATTIMLGIACLAQIQLLFLSTAEHVGSTYSPVSLHEKDAPQSSSCANGFEMAVTVGSITAESDDDA